MPASYQSSDPFNLRVVNDILYFDMEDGSTWGMMGGDYGIHYYGQGKELLTVWHSTGPSGPGVMWSWHAADGLTIYDLSRSPPIVVHGGLPKSLFDYVMIVRDKALEQGLLQP